MNDVARFEVHTLRAAAFAVLALSLYGCVDETGLNPAGLDPEGSTITAQVVAFDRSAPALEGLTYFDGTVTLEGIDVELWDGTAWRKVVDGLASATLAVGDADAGSTLLSATDLGPANYSRARLVATRGTAALSLTVDGQRYGAETHLGDGSLVFERDVEVVERDGVHMFRIGLETVTELTRHTASDGTLSVLMTGDLGSGHCR